MDNTVKRLIAYLAYVIFIVLLVLGVERLDLYIKHLYSFTYHFRYAQLGFSIMILFNITMGMLLALPGLLITRRLPGVWRIDWLPLLVVGLPSLCAALSAYTYWISPLSALYLYAIKHLGVVKIFCMLLGFVLINSWQKVTPSDNELLSDQGLTR
ncbi:MAG: hypothetical protein GXY34_03085 [Syntrophomonadaceae bacterium]|nr:hypothetical protein [Syntrophomonadaceae bacterium]